jgi:hypothetical protein
MPPVKLNIGGEIFVTSKSTLCSISESFFFPLFREGSRWGDGCGGAQGGDGDDVLFIDRDPTHFRRVLNVMRSGSVVWPRDAVEAAEFLIELEFYGLADYVERAASGEAASRAAHEAITGWDDKAKGTPTTEPVAPTAVAASTSPTLAPPTSRRSRRRHAGGTSPRSPAPRSLSPTPHPLNRDEFGPSTWLSNVIFVGYSNIDFGDVARDEGLGRLYDALQPVQCPTTSEMVWKSIHDPGLTVVLQLINSSESDFSLTNVPQVLQAIERWQRPGLRFVLVYDAELVRELLKLSNCRFNNTSFIWYFSKGRLIDGSVQWKLKYVSEVVWKHYYLSIVDVDRQQPTRDATPSPDTGSGSLTTAKQHIQRL